jgi:uncharacterized protein (PEP-CTERM system associated)
LNRLNEVQTTSFGLSPYLLRKFGDYGTAKLGVSVNVSRSASLSGFAQPPIPTGGTNGQSLLTTEQIAQFTTGEKFGKWQDSLNVDMSQSGTQADATSGAPATTTTSRRQTVTNQVSYALSHVFTLQASIGEQNIQYSQSAAPSVNGLTWSVGLTVTPDPYSSITIKYGHQNGVDNVTGDAHVALTGRTMLTADYSNSIGTQLENLQNQLNNSVLTQYGSQINALTGGPAYVASNGLGSQNGVFRFNTLNASLSTTWDRDTLQATLSWSMQTSVSPGYGLSSITIDPITDVATLNYAPTVSTGQSTVLKTASVIWTHSLRPELTLSTSAAYNTTQRSGSLGSDGSLSSSIGLQYQFPSGSTLSARYSFFDRISKIPGYSLYENLALVGFTKKF